MPTPKGTIPASLPKAQAAHRRNATERRILRWLEFDPSPEDRAYIAALVLAENPETSR